MLAILKNKAQFDPKLAESIASCMDQLQNMHLKQMPSIAEAIDWGNYLCSIYGNKLENMESADDIRYTLGVIAKNKEDEKLMRNSNLQKHFSIN